MQLWPSAPVQGAYGVLIALVLSFQSEATRAIACVEVVHLLLDGNVCHGCSMQCLQLGILSTMSQTTWELSPFQILMSSW